MGEEDIDEAFERLGYTGARKEAVKGYLGEYVRRKRVMEIGGVEASDIVAVSYLFDCLNRKRK